MIDEDGEEDGFVPPTPEEQERIEAQVRLMRRFPTFALLAKALMRYTRFKRLQELGAPEPVLVNSSEMRDKALDELCAAFPSDGGSLHLYHLEDVLQTLRDELIRPHDTSKPDA